MAKEKQKFERIAFVASEVPEAIEAQAGFGNDTLAQRLRASVRPSPIGNMEMSTRLSA